MATSAGGILRYYGMWKSMEGSDTADHIQQSRRDARKWYLVDILICRDHRAVLKENENVDKYFKLPGQVRTKIIYIVIGTMVTISKWLKTYISALGIPDTIEEQRALY